MLAMECIRDPEMRDLEQELADSLQRRHAPDGEPLAGLFALTHEMETDVEDQFDVDMTILDFLAYRATDVVFQWRTGSNPHQSDLPSALVTMTAEWRGVLRQRYSGRRLNNHIVFRSRLLQFVLLFTHRMNHDKTWTNEESLNELRAKNWTRGSYWRQETSHAPAIRNAFDTHKEFPLSDGALTENRQRLASALDIPQDRRRWVTDVKGSPSLHCLLSLFIELTAARVSLGDFVPVAEWYQLAGQFMLQAVLEEYLRNGASGEHPFNTIFSFGCPGSEPSDDETPDISAMRKLFCDNENGDKQTHGWAKTKRHYINELLPPQGSSISFLKAMENAQDRYPYPEFERNLLDFLQSLHKDFVKPDLVQVEEGRIIIHGNELPAADSDAMIRRMGL